MIEVVQTPGNIWAGIVPTLVFALALGAGVSTAGERRHGPPDPERHVERLTEELDLSDDQAVAILAILEDHQADVEALRESRRGGEDFDREAMREAMRASREEGTALIEDLLDEDQIAAFQSLREERKARRGTRKRGRGEQEAPSPDESVM